MEKYIFNIIALIVGAIIGGVVSSYFDLRKQIIGDVWRKRFEQYKKLWTISGNIPKWPRDDKLTKAKLYNISIALKNWYFNDGGLLLSKKSREKYETVQELITNNSERNSEDLIEPTLYEEVRRSFSNLRSEMTRDMSSRHKKLIN